MKIALLLFFVGLASASFRGKVLRSIARDIEDDFAVGVDSVIPLNIAAGVRYSDELGEVEEDIKKDIIEGLKTQLDSLLEKVKDGLEHGRDIAHDTIDKIKEITQKLKDMHVEVGGRAKELLTNIVERFKDVLGKLKDRFRDLLNINGKRSVQRRGVVDYVKGIISQVDIRAILEHVKEMIIEKLDQHLIQKYLIHVLDPESALYQQISDLVKDKSSDLLQRLIERLLRQTINEVAAAPSISDVLEKGKDIYKDVKGGLKDKVAKLLDWINEAVNAGAERARERVEKLKEVAKEFVHNTKEMTREAIEEALSLFEQYKEELGHLYDEVRESAHDFLSEYTD